VEKNNAVDTPRKMPSAINSSTTLAMPIVTIIRQQKQIINSYN
jgi:hypothetical protein